MARYECLHGCDSNPCVLGQHRTVYMPHHLCLDLEGATFVQHLDPGKKDSVRHYVS